jgi:hypothetical protein
MTAPRVTAFEAPRLGATCVQLRRAAQAGGCMVRDHGRFAVVAELAGVEVVDQPPGPYAAALSTPVPAFPPAAARPGPILVSRRSSRGPHDIPVDGIEVDGLPLVDLHALVLRASVLVGPNSGAAHFAALFGCRTIVFDGWHHHSMLPEGAGHWFAYTEAGLQSILATL